MSFWRPHDVNKLRARFLVMLLLLLLVISPACKSAESEAEHGIIVVNSPATGEVRRIISREGAVVNQGAGIIEIAVKSDVKDTQQSPADNPQARAVKNIESSQSEVEEARKDVIRTEVEVQRLTPLVASGNAPQAQLDGARAEYDRAQQRLKKAQASAQDAQAGLVAARQPSLNPTPLAPTEQIVTAVASSAGTVTAISVQVGARVTAGQPIATLRSQ